LFRLLRKSKNRPPELPPSTILPEVSTRQKVNKLWSVSPKEKYDAQGWYWLSHPMVRERVNILISGNQWLDAYGCLGAWLQERGQAMPWDHRSRSAAALAA
jgi:hypothetical protein